MFSSARAGAAAVLCVSACGPVGATETWWAPVLVSDPPQGSQQVGSGLALDDAGNISIVFDDQLPFAQGNIRLRRLSPGGTSLSAPERVNATDGLHVGPAIAALGTGSVVVWAQSPFFDLQTFVILARRYDALGVALGPEEIVSPHAQSGPRVAANAAGDYVVSWFEGDAPHARVFNAAGQPLSAPFAMPDLGETFGLGLTATRQVVAGSMTSAGATLQCFAADGAATGPASLVAANGTADANTASLAITADDSIVLGWSESSVLNAVRLRNISPDCTSLLWTADVNLLLGSSGGMGDVHVTASRTGNQIGVSWVTHEIARSSAYARRYTTDGVAISEPHLLTTGMPYLGVPQLAVDGAGVITAAWSQPDLVADDTYDDVYASGTGKDGARSGSPVSACGISGTSGASVRSGLTVNGGLEAKVGVGTCEAQVHLR